MDLLRAHQYGNRLILNSVIMIVITLSLCVIILWMAFGSAVVLIALLF